ncbi:MAG: hypothetical protein DRJ03_06915 [Chloroflexi bacterium]|nr:MAG: hypothetical protein DRJ03_06915 [Chloroflexota bacterium]
MTYELVFTLSCMDCGLVFADTGSANDHLAANHTHRIVEVQVHRDYFEESKSKERRLIMAEVLLSAEPVTQLPRLLRAINTHSSVIVALDNLNYSLAMMCLQMTLSDGAITQDDYDLIVSKIPALSGS